METIMKTLALICAAMLIPFAAFAQEDAPDVNKVIEDLAAVGPDALLSRVKELKQSEQALKDEAAALRAQADAKEAEAAAARARIEAVEKLTTELATAMTPPQPEKPVVPEPTPAPQESPGEPAVAEPEPPTAPEPAEPAVDQPAKPAPAEPAVDQPAEAEPPVPAEPAAATEPAQSEPTQMSAEQPAEESMGMNGMNNEMYERITDAPTLHVHHTPRGHALRHRGRRHVDR